MKRTLLAALLGSVLLITTGTAQNPRPPAIRPPTSTPAPAVKFTPKFEVVAETRLLMEGLLHANYRGVNKLLARPPADLDTWVFARGQAILIAEAGNLLLLRPPRGTARDTWMKLAMDMRTQATALARQVAAKDHAGTKVGLARLTDSCNRCHTAFRVPVKVGPEKPEMDVADRAAAE